MFDVVTIGTATRDVFLTSPLFKVLKDPKHLLALGFKTGEAECFALGGKLDVNKPIFTLGGGAANAAVTFARQGLKAAVVIKLGDDNLGEAVMSDLKKEKVTPLVSLDKNVGTAYSTILITPEGERTILVYRGASADFKKKEIPFSKLRANWAYIVPGNIDLSLMREIIADLRKKGISIAMNPSKHYVEMGATKLKDILNKIQLVIMNREEASILTNLDYKKERAIFKKFDELVHGIAVLTDGRNGSMVSDGRYIYRAGVFKDKKVVDRTGAGDAFGSGFVAGLIQKHDINHALRVASANATSVVEQIGAEEGILRRKDLESNRFKYLDLDVEPLG
ncbi:MAG: carbohydrate kinase family protein [Patescibacteria group bacterium]